MARKARLRSLSLFLLREDLASWDEALVEDDATSRHETRASSGLSGLLVAKANPGKAPWWRDYVAPAVRRAGDLDRLRNSSTSAVFLFSASARRFALTFGYGRYLLEPDSFEYDFGLRVVLNTVQPELIRSVDARTIDDLPMQTQRNAIRGSAFEDFGLDVSRDLVRAVSGPPRDETIGSNLAGADRLAISTRAQISELPGLCKRLLEAYRSTAYKERYPWIDHLRPIKDADVVEELQSELIENLNNHELDNIHLAPPESLDPLRLAGFSFSSSQEEDLDPDPRISRYLETLDGDAVDLARLKKDKVQAYESEGEQLLGSWSVLRCLVFETGQDPLYVLTAGNWFQVSGDFQKETLDFVESISPLDIDLPGASVGVPERAYNEGAAGGDLLNMDRELVRVTGQAGGVELCDLLSRNKQLIHVKRRGYSSTLSHLFSQGAVSAQLLLSDQEFRTAARAVVDGLDVSFTEVLPESRPEPSDYEVAYVVITRATPQNTNPLTLPFFSLVNLAIAVRQLYAFGFKVAVKQIDEA